MGLQCHYGFGEKQIVTQNNKELETFIFLTMLVPELN